MQPPSFTAIVDYDARNGEGFQILPPHFYDESGVGEAYIHPCVNCNVPFLFNPHTVVSIRLNLETGRAPEPGEESERYPLCNACANKVNRAREAAGMAPVPLPRESTR
jgi:hypothetical protein